MRSRYNGMSPWQWMHKNSVIVEPPLHFALIDRNTAAATNHKAARTTYDNIHVKFIDRRDESDPALLLQELRSLCACADAHTQNPVVDGQGQHRGRRGMRGRNARVCACVWRSAGGVISWSLPAAATASDARRRPRRPRAHCCTAPRNLRHTHAFRSHRKTRCIVRHTMGGYESETYMPLHATAAAAAAAAIPSHDWLPYHFRLKNKAIIILFFIICGHVYRTVALRKCSQLAI